MAQFNLVGFSGSYNRPSKTFALVDYVAELASARYGLTKAVYDLEDLGKSLGNAKSQADLDSNAAAVLSAVVDADILVMGSPTYKGSYPGMFKHFIDLIEPEQLRGKPILITGTGGGERHALMVEHQLRPLFGFFMAHTIPTAIYASSRDFTGTEITAQPLQERIGFAIDELSAFVSVSRPALLRDRG
ncbi:FMN reductase [Aliirhizobium terrae]|uniref:FMN reductase n=1 Tax=Terrirhizobium terrae TaxID=2926709 RepID=UPI0025772C1D|nr:FMN reductase [Rhizobium sp. CC-CFT758]WJH40089.1 FMN reductase [Rhizobium sp. CC-CFT758]